MGPDKQSNEIPDKYELLLVEDQPIVRKTVSTILSAKGFAVTAVASVPEALSLINSRRFDLLVSDLNIDSERDGLTVVAAMQAAQPEALTFILTASHDPEAMLWAIRHKVDDYFSKTADIETLAAKLKEHMDSRNSARESLREPEPNGSDPFQDALSAARRELLKVDTQIVPLMARREKLEVIVRALSTETAEREFTEQTFRAGASARASEGQACLV